MLDAAISRGPVRGGMPSSVRLLIALSLPVLAAVTVVGIYLGREFVVAALWVGLIAASTMFAEPMIGIIVLAGGLLLQSYPTMLSDLGVLTLGNLFGIFLVVQLAMRVIGIRDLSFLRAPQIAVLIVIGLIFIVSVVHSSSLFPLLQATARPNAGPRAVLDKTSMKMMDFWKNLVLLIFTCAFVERGRDVRALFLTFLIVLYLAVPSALVNWWQGQLFRGFRAAASLTVGANANRLAMICLVQIACWWFWGLSRPGMARRLVTGGIIASATVVLFATGSRSGLLGAVLLIALLQTGPRLYRVPVLHIGYFLALAAVAIAFFAPPEAWDRMIRFSQEDPHAAGYSSTVKREETLEIGFSMFQNYGLTGVGMGNFQEVSRQVYNSQFYKPTHNSYLWAAVEGGVFCISAYLFLFWITWQDIGIIVRLAHRDPSLAFIAPCLRVVFLLHCFFSAFADLWLNPITYVLIGMVITTRRYLESVSPTPHARTDVTPLALAVAS